MSLLGIHVGAEAVTAVVYDIEGRPLGRGVSAYKAEASESGVPELWMDAVWDCLREAVLRACRGAQEPVTAMSLAVRGDAFVAIDADGGSLGASSLPEDRQADAVAQEYHERISPIEVMRLTGMPPASNPALVRLLWLKSSRPEDFDRAWKFMGWHDYLADHLGPGPVTDPSLAGRTQMFDVVNGVWADRIIDEAGIDREKLADVRAAGTALGEISRRAAEDLRLPAGVRFVVGGYDRAVAALGVGAVSGGRAINDTDGVEYLAAALHEPVVDSGMLKNGFTCTPHVVPGMFVAVADNPTGGRMVTWLANLLGAGAAPASSAEERAALDRLVAGMDERPTNLLVLPYFGPSGTPYHEARPIGSIVGLSSSTKPATIVRAAIEGLALEMKLNALLLAESHIRLTELNVTGPPARLRDWCRIKADVLGLTVRPHADVDAAVRGAAMLAGIGTGVYGSVASAVEFCVNPDESVPPNGDRSDFYARTFERYKRLYPALRESAP